MCKALKSHKFPAIFEDQTLRSFHAVVSQVESLQGCNQIFLTFQTFYVVPHLTLVELCSSILSTVQQVSGNGLLWGNSSTH